MRRRAVRGERREAGGAAAQPRADHAGRQGPARARAGGRDCRRRPLLHPRLVAVSDDGARARQWMRPLVAHYLGLLHGQSILEDAGIPAARSQPFREAFITGRAAAADLVTNDLLDAVAIAGTPAECRSALERWAEAGLDAVIAVVPEAGDLAVQIERIGRELSPAWRQLRCR
ncbi:MAG: hypothetical protein DME08_08060 [Candidatus Rokuibacteriota bacterium]|nr:MAG: hypothetical protein DME08_08060 [Candidatus Rokubacteria bacterium]